MPNPFTQPITTLGETVGRHPGIRFGIYRSDRLFHLLILGQTGAGKSTLIKNMVLQDIKNGEGFCLIDPHGDLAEAVRPSLPDHAIYWDVADPDCQYGYNALSYVAEEYRPLIASAIIDTFKKQWADAWGVRMEHCLRMALLALLSRPGSSLADIIPMFTDKSFRGTVLQSVDNPEVLKFWRDEYPAMNYKNAFDGVAPIANKLGVFLTHPMVKKTLCEPVQPLRFRALMDQGTPIVVNLSKGKLGTGVSEVLGGLILSMITQAAVSRQDLPLHRRRPFFVYVDEFSNFTTLTVAVMLSELRKFKVGLILAAQYTSGITQRTLDAILGNVGNILVFRIGINDAGLFSRQLGAISPDDLVNLPNYRLYIRLMIQGITSSAFSARSLP